MSVEVAPGLVLETVGEILGDLPAKPTDQFVPAALPDTPAFPAPGLYFGMDDATYHAIPALSSSGIKKLAASPMLFWASTSWLSEKKRRKEAEASDDKAHHTIGKAYHCRIMEGRAAFDQRFVVELDPADYPNALVKTDQIKAAIGKFETQDTRKSASEGDMVPVKPVSKVDDKLPDGSDYQRAAVKADWIDQLLALDPEAEVFDRIQAAFLKEHAGKTVIPFEAYEQIEIAAAMIERDPEVQHAFKGGHAEVSLFWRCAVTGIPMKARVDYLKIKAMVDLKSVGNQRERSIENAIRWEIASYHYNIQPSLYVEGAEAVRAIVREQGTSAIHVMHDCTPVERSDLIAWACKWASHRGGDDWFWVFQQKGDAPITRGVKYRLGGSVRMVTDDIVSTAKRAFRKCSEAFGVEPWLDVKPIYDLDDEDIPLSATEI